MSSDRYQVVEHPTTSPGHCYFCRAHEGPFIHTGISDEFIGTYFICVNCVNDMASKFGSKTAEQVADLEESLVELSESNAQLTAEVKALEESLDALGSLNSILGQRSGSVVRNVLNSQSPTRATPGEVQGDAGPIKSLNF